MKFLRYKGEFSSRAGIVWRCEIWQEADGEFNTVGELEFGIPPLVIEWKREDKEKVICGSSATLQIISPGDRTYEDLYTIEAGRILLKVYRVEYKEWGPLEYVYWSGTLDPEFYEEPYEAASGYTVTLTFSDFGIWDRIKYGLAGRRTLMEILMYAIDCSGFESHGIGYNLISTVLEEGHQPYDLLDELSVLSENFTDEDGEASTLKEVVEGILQPLGLRIIQRMGWAVVYDLNGLYLQGLPAEIVWEGDRQTMGTDKVANNVTVSFSPYSSGKLMAGELEYGGKYSVTDINTRPGRPAPPEFGYGEWYSYYPDYSENRMQGDAEDANMVDFTIFLNDRGTGLKQIGDGCKYFHTLPVLGSAPETTGVAYAFRAGHDSIESGRTEWKLHGNVPGVPRADDGGLVLCTNRVFVPKLSERDGAGYRIRLAEEILLDARYNPFSGSTEGNEEENDREVKVWSAFVFIPARVTLYDESGKALYYYDNNEAARGAVVGHVGVSKGKWVPAGGTIAGCWLEYYNPDDLEEDAGIRGWHANRHCIGRPDGKGGRMKTVIFDSFKKMPDGEYMPYPPEGGYLEVQIFAGVYGYDYRTFGGECAFGSAESTWDRKDIYGKLRWCLYKAPKLEIVSNSLTFNVAELEDIEYSGYINRAAKEEISIDTICGTSDTASPAARGIYFRTDNGLQVKKLTRAGRTDHPEKLLIGTLYSQYAGRKTTLSGESRTEPDFCCYTERNQPGKRFMLMSDVQDLMADSSEAEYCELRPDEYDRIEEKI